MIARELKTDPVELRLKNYRGLHELDPLSGQTIMSDGMKECMEAAVKTFGWKEKKKAERRKIRNI